MTIGPKEQQGIAERSEGLVGMAVGAGIVFSGKLSGKFLLFLYTVFLAATLNTSEIGIYFLGVTVVGFAHVAANIGLKVGVTRYVSIYHGRGDWANLKSVILSALVVSTISSLILTSIFLLVAEWCSVNLFGEPRLSEVLMVFSFSIPAVSTMWIFLAATRGMKMMQHTALIEEMGLVASRFLLAIIFISIFKDRLVGIVWAFVLSSWLCVLLSYFSMARHLPKVYGPLPVRKTIGPHFKFSVPMVFSMIMGQLNRQIDVIMIGVLLTAKDVGIYSIVIRIVLLAEIVARVFAIIFNPYAAQLHEDNKIEKLARFLKLITKWNYSISYPIFLSMMVFPIIFLNLFGNEFAIGAGCLIILSFTHLIGSFSDLTDVVIFMSGRSDITMKNNIGALTLNILLNYYFISYFGIMGAAIATGITIVGLSVVRIIELHQLMKIGPFDISALTSTIVGGALMFGIVLLMKVLEGHLTLSNEYLEYASLLGFYILYFILVFLINSGEEETLLKAKFKEKFVKLMK